MTLDNRVAVIAGATGGLGRVVARRLAHEGARLALLGTDIGRLEVLAGELGLAEERWLAQAVDLVNPGGAEVAAGAVLEKFGGADIVLQLVGGWMGGKTVTEVPTDDMDAMLNQHLWSTFHVTRAFVPLLLAGGWGRIVAVSSPSATRPPGRNAPYAVGKAAQEALLLTLAQEVAGTGVTANIVVVRTIDTQHRRDREHSAETALWTTPEEIAAAIVYLCSDAAGVVNGARLPLCGAP